MTDDAIEGTTREVALQPYHPSGASALAEMSDTEFDQRLMSVTKLKQRVRDLQRAAMTEDVDYGNVPGTKKPTLFKAGAETLNQLYLLVAEVEHDLYIGDGVLEPTIRYEVTCRLHFGDFDGPIVAIGYGSANSWESKYRWRKGDRTCPDCGVLGALFKGRLESRLEGRWWCPPDKGGCGSTFDPDDARIVAQDTGRVENLDPWDGQNTLLQMAIKRAYVSTSLRATGTSGLFTQDMAEDPEVARALSARNEPAQPAPENDGEWEGEARVVDDAEAAFRIEAKGNIIRVVYADGFDGPEVEGGKWVRVEGTKESRIWHRSNGKKMPAFPTIVATAVEVADSA